MKDQSKAITILFLCFIMVAQIAFVAVPTAKAFSLQDFTIDPDPSAMPLLVGHSYDFTLTATLPGGSGSNGVNVYVLPEAGPVGTTGIVISYTSLGYGTYPLHIPAHADSASVEMTIDIPSDVTPGPLPLTVTAYDNPGGGGTIIGTFSVTLHVNQIPLVVQTSGLNAATKVYIDDTQVGTAYDGVPYGPVWYQLDPATGTVTIGAIDVDNTVSGSVQYFFSHWADSSSNPHPAITTSEPVTLTANYVTKTSQITVTSNPAGSGFVKADGSSYSTPHTFTWAVGSTHSLEALSPVASADSQYVFDSWSDSGAQSHSYTVLSTSPDTITSNYRIQYSVTLAVNPVGAGETSPTDGTSIWTYSGPLPISATAEPGYHFDHWTKTGSITFADSSSASTTASIGGSGTVTANFAFNDVTHFSISAPSSVTAGQSFLVTVTALDADGNTITGYTGIVHITSSDPQADLPSDATLINGIGDFTVTLKTASSQLITATDQAKPEITGSTSVTVNADGSPIRFEVDAPTFVTAGVPLVVSVTAKDPFGNTIEGYSGTIHFTSTDNSAVLPSDYTFQASDLGSKDFDGMILETAGVQTITATDTLTSSITGTSNEITVAANADNPKTIIVSPSSAQISAGNSQTFKAELFDIYGNSLGDVTVSVTWSIDAIADGQWVQTSGTYTSAVASPEGSPWTVTASLDSLSGTAILTVTHSTDIIYLQSIEITPHTSTIAAGETQSYTATATDSFGNTWDVTSDISTANGWTINAEAKGSWSDSTYTSEAAGSWTVTGTYLGKSATADLTVTHATDQAHLDHISASVNPTTVPAPNIVTGSATAYDTFGNSWDVSTLATWSIPAANDGGSWSINVYTSHTAGTFTVQAVFEGENALASLTVTHATDVVYLDHITASVDPTSVAAPETVTGTATAFDNFGNSWDISTLALWSIPAGNDGGSWSINSYTSHTAGTYVVQAAYQGKTADASLIVTHSTNDAYLDHIVIAPKNAAVNAGVSQTYVATAFDTSGNSWSVSATYSCTNNNVIISDSIAYSNVAGDYTITGAYQGKSDTATLTVNGHLSTITTISVAPKIAIIAAGLSKDFVATASDGYNNWDVTSIVSWSIDSAAGGSWNQNSGRYTSANAGSWTVKATLGDLSDTASLTVNANSALLTHIVITPKIATVSAGNSKAFTATAYDLFNNNLGEVTSSTTFTAPGASVTANSVTANNVGSYNVTATYNGLTDTANLTVTGYTLTFTEKGLPTGTSWNVTLDGHNYVSTTNTITVNDLSALSYSWSTSNTIQSSQIEFLAAQTSGSISVPSQLNQNIDYSTQYLVTYNTVGNVLSISAPVNEWVNSGGQATGSFAAQAINAGQNTRCNFISDNRPSAITQPTTVTGTYLTQYYLTVSSAYASTTGAGWYDSGSTATAGISTGTAGSSGTQYLFTSWSGDASGTSLTSSITMNSAKAATANWKRQYYLTVTSNYGNPSGQGWYDAGSTANIALSQTVTSGNSTRSVFNGWTGSGTGAYTGTASSQSVSMNSPITETASWKTQCLVTYSAAGNELTVTVPTNEWVNYGTAATGTFTRDITNSANDTRCIFVKDNRPSTVTQPTQITATYRTMYLVNFTQKGIESDATGTILTMLGITRDYSQLANVTWVYKGANVTFSFADRVSSTIFDKLYALTGVNATSPVTIEMPMAIQGTYEVQSSLYTVGLAGLIIFLILLLLALLVWRRRKRKQKQNNSVKSPQSGKIKS